MLTLLVLLAATQQAAPSMFPPVLIPPAPSPPPEAASAIPVLSPAPICVPSAQRANNTSGVSNLVVRDSDQAVGHYLLLDRRVGGCSDPIVVSHRVPGSNAVGRELGREGRPSGPPVSSLPWLAPR